MLYCLSQKMKDRRKRGREREKERRERERGMAGGESGWEVGGWAEEGQNREEREFIKN